MTSANRLLIAVFSLSLLTLAGCSEGEQAPQEAAMQMPPPPVTVATVVTKEISEWKEFTGRLEAS